MRPQISKDFRHAAAEWILPAVAVLALILPASTRAQEATPAATAVVEPTPAPTPDPYQEALRDAIPYPGLLTLYEKKGQLFCELRADQLDHVYLMFPAIKEGIGQGFLVSGLLYWDQHWTVGFRRVGQKIQFLKLNTRFRASANAQLARVVTEGYGHSVLASMDIIGESGGSVLVDLRGALFQDLADVGRTLSEQFGAAFRMDPTRSGWGAIKTFPNNVELDVRMSFTSDTAVDLNTVPDSRAVSLALRYSIVEPPDPGVFRPRILDDRVGFYYSALRDISLPGDEAPFVRYLHRWPLEKADAAAERSAPKQPLVFYLEKSIPYQYRPAVRRGILAWNRAFEALGIVDAIEVRFQPDDADWDAEDVRYTTIRWTSGPSFAGIGPVRVDPRTGQIVDADILIDSDVIRRYVDLSRIYSVETQNGPAALGDVPFVGTRVKKPSDAPPPLMCPLAAGLSGQIDLGLAVLGSPGNQPQEKLEDFLESAVRWYTMHEVGHTLGLRHNFKGTAAVPLERLQDAAWTRANGLSGSVMDYPGMNLAPPGIDQGEYFPSILGPWDMWAIEYGYRPIPTASTSEDELTELGKIAARSSEPALAYASDEDAFNWAFEDADPYVNVWDLSSDPLDWSTQRLATVRSVLESGLEDRVVADGERFQRLRRGFAALLAEYIRSMYYASRYVAGYNVTRVHKGEPAGTNYLTPVSREKQLQAIEFLGKVAFQDNWLMSLPPRLLANLPGETWNHWGMGLGPQSPDFPLQQYIWLYRSVILNRLYSEPILNRLQNSELAVVPPAKAFQLAEHFPTLHSLIWSEVSPAAEPTPGSPYITRFRRDLQRSYIDQLQALALRAGPGTLQDAVNLARADLTELGTQIDNGINSYGSRMDRTSLAHLQECKSRIERALQAVYEVDLQ